MPSGPKKRRASKRKKGGVNASSTDPIAEDEHLDAAGELRGSSSNASEMSLGDEKAEGVDEMASKEFKSVDQMGFKENDKESEDVTVLDKSEYVGNKESESESVDQVLLHAHLIEVVLKNPEENESAEVGESACHESTVVVKEGEEMSKEGILEEPLNEQVGHSSDELRELVKTADQSDLKVIPLKAAQKNVETSIKDVQDSLVDVFLVEGSVARNEFGKVGESEDHGAEVMVDEVVSAVKDGEEASMEGDLQDSFEEPSESYLHETQAMVKTVNESIPMKEAQVSVESDIEVDVETTSFEDAQETFETPLGSPSMGYMSPVEVDVHYWNEPIELSLPDPKAIVKMVGQLVRMVIPLNDDQYPCLPTKSAIDLNVETSLKDAPNSSSIDVFPVEGVDQLTESIEVGEREYQGSPDMINHTESVLKEDGEKSMDGVLIEPFEELTGRFSDELQAMVKKVDSSALEVILSKDAKESFVSVESLSEANVETSFEDIQDSFKEPLGDSYMDDVSLVERVVRGNECGEVGEYACHSLPTMVNRDELVMKEDEKMCVEGVLDLVIEENVKTSLEDGQDSFKEPMGNSSMDDVSSMDHGQPKKMVNDVESIMKEDEDMYIKGVLKENFRESNVGSLDEPQSMLQTVDQDPSIQAESFIEVIVSESLKVCQDSFEVPLGDSSMDDHAEPILKEDEEMSMEDLREEHFHEAIGHSPNEPKDVQDSFNEPLGSSSIVDVFPVEGLVNHVESVSREDEEMSMKVVLKDLFEEPIGRFSHEQETMIKTVDQTLTETRNLSITDDESGIELDVVSRDGQKSFIKPLGSPFLDEVSSVEINVHLYGFRNEANGQRNGQQNEMVGLAKTLLEEIRRIRAFYKERLRETTQIHLHICQVLEKFDSGKS